jgi:DNA polymerase III subunit beta
VRFDRNELSAAVTFAAQGCGTRDPVYMGMLMEAEPAGVTFTGSDGNITFRSGIEYDDGGESLTAILPGVFPQVIPALPGEDVTFSFEKGSVLITCGRAKFTLPLVGGDYPVKVPDVPVIGGVSGEDLTRALRRVLPAVGKNSPIPPLTGITLRHQGLELELRATDRYCMATAVCPFTPFDEHAPDIILPGAVARKLKLEGDVSLGWDERLIQITSSSGEMTCRSIPGGLPAAKYPEPGDWITLVPEVAEAIRRAALTGVIAVTLTFGKELVIESSSGQGGFAEELPLGYDGHARFTASPQMLLDGLAGCDKPEMSVQGPGKPVYIRDGKFLWALQPRKES